MTDQETPVGSEDLQFDRVITESTSAAPPSKLAVSCAGCQSSIETEYYDINGNIFCNTCRAAVESAAETPQGIAPLVIAGLFGLGAGIVGAAIYYAVIAIAHLEIGIVAILIGYMVGYAVRKGARGRGGRRFQVLAVALTYASIALAYTPLVFKQAIDADREARTAAATATSSSNRGAAAATDGRRAAPPTPRGGLLAIVLLLAFIGALPVLMVAGSFPSGLISAFIIFIGLKQAWKMTAAPRLTVLGPYRVGAATAPIPA